LFSPVFEAPSIGDARLMDGLRQHRSNYEFWALSAGNALLLVYLLAALAGLGLFLLRRGESEYLWFAGFELFSAANYALKFIQSFIQCGFRALKRCRACCCSRGESAFRCSS
jgi:hypothetical protein